ncbi:MFS transporter small subunit [Actinomadura scrupuli]
MTTGQHRSPHTLLMVVAWAWVGLPFAYGVYELVRKVTQLFTG